MACITSELLYLDGEHIVDFIGDIKMTSIIGPRYKLRGIQSCGSGGAGFNLPDAVQLGTEGVELDALVTAPHPGGGQGRYLAKVLDINQQQVLLEWKTSPADSRRRDSLVGIRNPSIWERMFAAAKGESWAFEPSVSAQVMGVRDLAQDSVQKTLKQDLPSATAATLPQVYDQVSRMRFQEIQALAAEGPHVEQPLWSGQRLEIPASMAPTLKECMVKRCNVYLRAAPSNRNCPGGHHLMEAKLVEPEEMELHTQCDACSGGIEPGRVTFTCSMCDFDICQRCREIPTPDMVQKARASLQRLVQHGLSSGGALRTHLAVISSPGNLSEQQSSLGYRTRSVSGDRESCLPLTGALQDCLNVQKAFQSGGARLPNQTIMSKTFPRGQPKSISEKEVVLEKITKATILRSLRFQLMVEDALCFGTYNFKQLYIIILHK